MFNNGHGEYGVIGSRKWMQKLQEIIQYSYLLTDKNFVGNQLSTTHSTFKIYEIIIDIARKIYNIIASYKNADNDNSIINQTWVLNR